LKSLEKIKELVLQKLDLTKVMMGYGVEFIYNPLAAQEVQFKCPFHGKDNKPSARLYRETGTCWCWVCHKKWDVVDFIKDKEGLGYRSALLFIVDRYRIDISSIPDTPTLEFVKPKEVSDNKISLISLKNRILELKGRLALDKYKALVSAWYMVSFAYSKGLDVAESIIKLESKL